MRYSFRPVSHELEEDIEESNFKMAGSYVIGLGYMSLCHEKTEELTGNIEDLQRFTREPLYGDENLPRRHAE